VTRIVAFVPDLMDRSKIAAAAGDRVRFVATPAELAGAEADLFVVDLSRPGSVDVLASLQANRVLAFGSHVDRDTLDSARQAGASEVMPRSEFFRRLAELLA
jgi:hypothetical protein